MPVRKECPAVRFSWQDPKPKKYEKYTKIHDEFKNTEAYKKHREEHTYYAGEMDRLYRREFANKKYRWVATDMLQCRICKLIVNDNGEKVA